MNATMRPTDAAIETMLARRAARPEALDLTAPVMAAVAVTSQVRRPWLRLPERPAWMGAAARPAGLIAAALLLLALTGAAIIGARLLEETDRHPTDLLSTGFESLRPEGRAFEQVVVDGRGVAWAYGEGVLARLARSPSAVRTWTFADDAAFGRITDIAPARDQGVWLIGDDGVRLFDGERFLEEAPIQFGVADQGTAIRLAEDAGGVPFFASGSVVFRWDDTVWSAKAGLPTEALGSLAIATDPRDGSVWVAGVGRLRRGLARFDGERWRVVPDVFPAGAGGAGDPEASGVRAMAFGPDGRLWLAGDRGVAVFDGRRLRDLGLVGATALSSISIEPDGTVWVTGVHPTDARQVVVAAWNERAWSVYGATDGLPATDDGAASVAAARNGVFLGTSDGIELLDGATWKRTWPRREPGPLAADAVLAVSHDEAWAVGTDRPRFSAFPDLAPGGEPVPALWHYVEGGWRTEADPGTPVQRLALASDGTLLATTETALYARRDARWETLWRGTSGLLAPGPGGVVYVARTRGEPYPRGTWSIEAVALDGSTVGAAIPDPPLYDLADLAVGRDGSLWAASPSVDTFWGWGMPIERAPGDDRPIGAVAHYVDGRWTIVGASESPADRALRKALETEDPPRGRVAVGADGAVWVAWNGGRRVGRFDGSTWSLEAPPIPPGRADPGGGGIVAAGDGTVWLAIAPGQWDYPDRVGCRGASGWRFTELGIQGLSAAPDGTVFVAAPGGVGRAQGCH